MAFVHSKPGSSGSLRPLLGQGLKEQLILAESMVQMISSSDAHKKPTLATSYSFVLNYVI